MSSMLPPLGIAWQSVIGCLIFGDKVLLVIWQRTSITIDVGDFADRRCSVTVKNLYIISLTCTHDAAAVLSFLAAE